MGHTPRMPSIFGIINQITSQTNIKAINTKDFDRLILISDDGYDIDFMIIVDIGKADVENVVNMLWSKNIPYDNIYIQKENYPELLKGPSIHELGFIKEMLRK